MGSKGAKKQGNFTQEKKNGEDELVGIFKSAYDNNDSEILNNTVPDQEKEKSSYQNAEITILGIWTREKTNERSMKIKLFWLIAIILGSQVLIINLIVMLIGWQFMKVEEWTLRLFIAGVFGEVVALIKIITTNLFPQNGSKDFMNFIDSYCMHQNQSFRSKKNDIFDSSNDDKYTESNKVEDDNINKNAEEEE